jgi:Protein of unknown function (DUF1203)
MSALSSTTSPESTEALTTIQPNLPLVQLKYIPLPAPLPALQNPITISASEEVRGPCRRCLLDAQPGDMLYLINYDPFPSDAVSPYRGGGPIFVHAHDCGHFSGDVLPERQLRRQMSVRAYDEKHMMIGAETVEGNGLEVVAGGMLADEKVVYVNVHNAKPGCFAVRVERA